jgi:leader peptidase (prepilin peptidase)/N-methyltransferase
MGVLASLAYLRTAPSFSNLLVTPWLEFSIAFVVAAAFVVLFIFDIRHYILPDIVIFPTAVAIFVLHGLQRPDVMELSWMLAGVSVYVGILGLVAVITHGRGMGWGDVKLGILLGIFLSFPLSLAGLLIALWLAALVAVPLLFLQKKGMKDKLPFGPFLMISALLVWYFDELVLRYMFF